MTSDMVGRTTELGWLHSVLATPPCAVVVAGPAGVGKSRLAREVCDQLAPDMTVVRVHASEAASAVPFGAVAHAVEPPDLGAPDLASMLRVTAERLLAQIDGPGLLLVDDAQLLDDPTVALVHHLIHASELSVLLVVRTGEPAPADIERLWADDRVELLELQHLDETETTTLVSSLCAGPVDATTADEIWRATEGNPLFIRELVTGAVADGRLRADEGLVRLHGDLRAPARLTELVRSRLRTSEEADAAALDLLAVTGPVDLDVFVGEVGADVADRLERSGATIVAIPASDADRAEVRLGHPLFAEALVETMSTTRRRMLQRRAATLLQELPGAAFRYREAILRIECGLGVDRATVEHATHYALACFDREAAERLVRSAITSTDDRRTRAELFRVLAKLLRWSGRHDEAETLLRQVDVDDVDDSRVLTDHVLARSENLFRGLLDASAARDLLDTAREVSLADADAERIEAFDASLLLLEGRVTDAALAAESVIGRGSDPAAAATASVVLSYAQGRAGRFDRAIDAAELAAALARTHDDALAEDPGGAWTAGCLALADAGELDRCDDALRAGPEGADTLDPLHWQSWRELIRARVEVARGRMSTAVLHARSAALSFRDLDDHALERVAWAGVARVEGQRGVVASEAIERARTIDAGPFELLDCEIEWGAAWVAIAQGHHTRGLGLLESAADAAADSGQFAVATAIAHDALRVAPDPAVARTVLDHATSVDGALAGARVAHARSVIAADVDGHVAAAETFATSGMALLAAETFAQASAVARDRGDARRGRLLAGRADRARKACEDADTPSLRRLREREPLTKREREVATLAASGLTGPEISEQLYVSVRTVNNHLQHVYRKLGVDGRGGLANALQLGDGASG